MSEESQITVPPSFIALYLEPGRTKPSAPREVIAARYEFCEDLASLLTEHAKTQLWELSVNEDDVLDRIRHGLEQEASGVSTAEADWVTRRLAELLGWD